jgi:predicted nucleotidyltransferase
LSEKAVSLLRLWHHFRALRDKSLHGFATRRTAKLWLYALRAQLAMLWLEQGRGLPPSAVGELCASLPEEPGLREDLAFAIAAKRLGRESDGDFVPPHSLSELLRKEQEREESSGNVRTFAWTIPALAESHSPDVKPEVRKAADELFRSFLA